MTPRRLGTVGSAIGARQVVQMFSQWPTRRSRLGVAAVLSFVLAAAVIPVLQAQATGDVAELRTRLSERYDIAMLQNGIGLVPKQPDPRTSIIQIRNGAVSINGEELTGRELRARLGSDADLVLRITYLDEAQQRQLAASEPGAPAAGAPAVSQPAASDAAASVPGRRSIGEIVRVGGNVRVERDEIVERDVVVVMGSAHIDGEVQREVTVVMGSLTLGPEAIVHRDVNVIGGTLNRSPTARIDGSVKNVGLGGGPWNRGEFGDAVRDTFFWRMGGLAGTLLRVTLVLLLALAVVALGPAYVARIADRTVVDPLRAGLIGFFAELLFFPVLVITVVVLAISIIGIPLLVLVPFGIVLALVVLLVGFTGVAYQVGRTLHARFGWSGRGAYASVALGVIVIGTLTVLARSAALIGGGIVGFPLAALGYFVEYVAWTIGFGAAILVWLHRRRPEVHVPALP
jgi:hypothetical protein